MNDFMHFNRKPKLASPSILSMKSDSATSEAERNSENWPLNFAISPGEESEKPFVKKPKSIRDPMSHRIIEKRRRDRMNNCLADLSRLIPTNYMKQGQGRIEKTEIIEMAIKHINSLNSIVKKHGALKSSLPDRYLGFKECQDEVMRYLVEVEEWDVHDKLCSTMMSHLDQAGEKFRIMNDESLSQASKEEQYRHLDEDLMVPEAIESGGQKMQEYEHNSSNLMPVCHDSTQNQEDMQQTSSSSSSPESVHMQFVGLEALASAQQITQELLKHDKQLWTQASSSGNSGVFEDSGISSGTVSHASKKAGTMRDMSQQLGTVNLHKAQQEPVPTFTAYNSSESMYTGSDKNDYTVYKFKHNIQKRFSQEGKKPASDYSSSGSQDSNCKVKKKCHGRCHSPGSSSTHYPNSDSSNNNSSNSNTDSNRLLPGFVLHPIGTHYVPLSIHPTDIITEFFDKDCNIGQKVLHPISIPVNFGGPLLCMKRVTDWKIESSEGSGHSPGMSSSANSSSENSPNPEQDATKATSY